MNDGEIENLRRAFTAPGGTAPRPEDCPPAETLWAAVHGELPPGALRDVVDHIATCPACAEDWRLAVEVEREATATAEVAAGRAASPVLYPRRWLRLAPLLAAAAAIVALVVGLPLVHHENEPTYRGGPQKVASQVVEGQELPRDHCLLLWSGPKDATYEIEVDSLTGDRLFSKRGLKVLSYEVPKSCFNGVRPGTRLEWRVTATPPRGAPVHSKTSTFILQ
jgi:hypothetical protein